MNPVAVTPEIDAEAVAAGLENRTATEAIEWMFETFGQNHYIACSFQKTSSVTAHLATQVNSDARFFYLDTDVLFPETYETRDRLAEQLGIEFDRYHNVSLAEQAEKHGDELWNRDSDACCSIR
ncbi:MAG TPA: phosphoadenosine phosphosulfate reductase family protein, partial [Solirubrobacterales bacterium]